MTILTIHLSKITNLTEAGCFDEADPYVKVRQCKVQCHLTYRTVKPPVLCLTCLILLNNSSSSSKTISYSTRTSAK